MSAYWFDSDDDSLDLEDFRDPEHAPKVYKTLENPMFPNGPDTDEFVFFQKVSRALDLTDKQVKSLLKYFKKCQVYTDTCDAQRLSQKKHDLAKACDMDHEVGGRHMQAAMQAGTTALRKFGSKDLSKELQLSGLGQTPAFLKFAARVGQAYDPRRNRLKQ